MIRFLSVLMLLACLVQPVAAEAKRPGEALDPTALRDSSEPVPEFDSPPGLAAYVSGAAEALLRDYGEAGLAVSVTGPEGAWLVRGFGLADADARREVDGETLFPIASITKTFTWTAVMMLVDRGLLDLDRNVNDYLRDLKVPEACGEPVTMRHLMTHTAGFEDTPLYPSIDPDGPQTLAEALAASMPARVFAPGERRAYSNWGTELAALVVADVSGMSFDDFLRREILDPLGMRSTTIADAASMEETHAARLAKGYRRADGRFQARPLHRFGATGAAGEMAASANDMARWMRFHLNRGELDGIRLMARSTHERMWPSALDASITAATWSHGFMLRPMHGLLQVGHGGGLTRYRSLMWLAPEAGFGVFAVSNGGQRVGAGPALADRVFAHRAPPRDGPAAAPEVELAPYGGDYLTNWRGFTTFYRVLANRITVRVRADGNEALLVQSDGRTQRYRPVSGAPDVFENASGERIVFQREGERVVAIHLPLGRTSHERVSGIDHPRTLQLAGAITVLLALTTLLGVWRRWRQAPESTAPGRRAATIAAVSALVVPLYIGVLIFGVTSALSTPADQLHHLPTTALVLAVAAGWAVAAAALAMLVGLYFAWRGSDWGGVRRLHYTAFALALTGSAALLWHWRFYGAPIL